MAIIACPACGQRISDKHDICPHCGADRGGGEEATDRMRAQIQREKRYRLQMQTYAATAIFVGAMAWMWFDTDGNILMAGKLQLGLAVGSVLWYLVTRGRMMFGTYKRKKADSE